MGDSEAIPGWAGGTAFPNETLNEVMADAGPLIWQEKMGTFPSPVPLISCCLT